MSMANDFVYSKDGIEFHPMPTKETHESLAEKGYKPYVFLTRDGKPENYYPVPADDNLAKEFAEGAQTPTAWNFVHDDDRYRNAKLPSEVDSFVIGLGRGLTSDGLDEGFAGAEKLASDLIGRPDDYKKRRDELRKVIQVADEVNPGATGLGQFIGGIGQGVALSAIPPVGAAMKAAPVLSGAVSGALQGYGASKSDDIKDQALDTAAGGAIGAGITKAAPIVIDKVVKPAAKVAGKVLFGVPKWLSEAYYANPDKFKNLPEPETVWREAGDIVRKSDDNVGAAKDNFNFAKDALSDEKAAISSHYDTLRDEAKGAYANAADEFKVARARAEAKAGEARDALKTASVDAIDALRNVQPTAQMAKDIVARHAMQRQITKEMSQAANEALDQSGLTLDKPTIMGLIDKAIDGLKVPGTDVHASDKAVAAAKSLMAQKARLENLPEDLSAVQSRKLMQDLRTDIDFGSRSLEYNAALDNARMKVTEGISGILKAHGGKYADDMADLASRMRMLKDADKYFGDEQRAMGSLMLIASRNPKAAPAEETLRQYLGQDLQQLQKQLSMAQRAKEVLTSNAERRALTAGLPEQRAVQAAEKEALRYDPIKLKESEQAAIAAWDRGNNTYYHGSPENLEKLEIRPLSTNSYGQDFGGVFLNSRRVGHMGPGEQYWYKKDIHDSEIFDPNRIHYLPADDIKKVDETIRGFFSKKLSNEQANELFDAVSGNGDTEIVDGWTLQTIQGQVAKKLGYKAVRTADEHGESILLVGPASIQSEAAYKAWAAAGKKYGPETMDQALKQVIAEGPPEYQAMKLAEKQLGEFAPRKLKQLKAKAIMDSDAFRAMQDAQDLLMWHKEIKGSISDISENGMESLLAASARNKRNLTPKDKLVRLQQAGDEMGMPTRDYIDWAKTNAGNEIFDGGYQNGSANVNMFSLIGAALGGGAAGGGGGLPWMQAAFGAGMGRTVDSFGPKMGKHLIDASRTTAQSPTMQSIGRAVPRAVTGTIDITPSEYVRQQIDRKYREQLRKGD